MCCLQPPALWSLPGQPRGPDTPERRAWAEGRSLQAGRAVCAKALWLSRQCHWAARGQNDRSSRAKHWAWCGGDSGMGSGEGKQVQAACKSYATLCPGSWSGLAVCMTDGRSHVLELPGQALRSLGALRALSLAALRGHVRIRPPRGVHQQLSPSTSRKAEESPGRVPSKFLSHRRVRFHQTAVSASSLG